MLRRLNVVLVLWLMGFSAFSSAAPTILVMGDSLSAAYGLETRIGWVNLLQQRLYARGYPHQVVNASISGETSSGGLTRVGELLAQHKPAILIIALGANDGLRGLSLKAMQQNLARMVEQAQSAQAAILLIGMQLPPNYGPLYNRRFQQIFHTLAEAHSTALLPFLLQGFGQKKSLFLEDGFHPNGRAQSLILDLVWPPLTPLLTTEVY
ncbi:MAG: arylesterase [Candidatus Polarisedimenticolaceae bacterium]|nr:arylesterase [Candidatus Polarisedimenticolaceae bacterium]